MTSETSREDYVITWSAQNRAGSTVSAQHLSAFLPRMQPAAAALCIGGRDPELRVPELRRRSAPKSRERGGRCAPHKNHGGGRGWLGLRAPGEGKRACPLFPGKGRQLEAPCLTRDPGRPWC